MLVSGLDHDAGSSAAPSQRVPSRWLSLGGEHGTVMPVYIGERYVPGAAQDLALAQAEQVRSSAHVLASRGSTVTLLSTTFVANEEWVFDVFQADSREQVLEVYAESGVAVERVTEGVHLPGS